jgi:hypothetical protein
LNPKNNKFTWGTIVSFYHKTGRLLLFLRHEKAPRLCVRDGFIGHMHHFFCAGSGKFRVRTKILRGLVAILGNRIWDRDSIIVVRCTAGTALGVKMDEGVAPTTHPQISPFGKSIQ